MSNKAYERTSRALLLQSTVLQQGNYSDAPRTFGLFAGLGSVADDFDTLSEEEMDLFDARYINR